MAAYCELYANAADMSIYCAFVASYAGSCVQGSDLLDFLTIADRSAVPGGGVDVDVRRQASSSVVKEKPYT
ncbi:hypothetical protein LTR22_027072 [Elasticomyces elasticus]|nr:hypothetical protein LTR22_027072 [Elasticomyces elasticus]